jgi:hypothetical protein
VCARAEAEAPADAVRLGMTSRCVGTQPALLPPLRVVAVQARNGVRAVLGGLAECAERVVVDVCVRGVVRARAGREPVKANGTRQRWVRGVCRRSRACWTGAMRAGSRGTW